MSGRLLFKEKQLRLCALAALTLIIAPVAESVVLPPKPLPSNVFWSCQSGVGSDQLCGKISRQSYKFNGPQRAEKIRQESSDLDRPSANVDIEPYQSLPVDSGGPSSLTGLLESPGSSYVLQWMAAKEPSQLEALKQRYPVLRDATIVQYERSGKLWYILLDGPYPSRMAAMAELRTPPRSRMAQELYPWTRSLASIQKLDLDVVPKNPAEQLAQKYRSDYQTGTGLPVQNNGIAPVNYDISCGSQQTRQQQVWQKAQQQVRQQARQQAWQQIQQQVQQQTQQQVQQQTQQQVQQQTQQQVQQQTQQQVQQQTQQQVQQQTQQQVQQQAWPQIQQRAQQQIQQRVQQQTRYYRQALPESSDDNYSSAQTSYGKRSVADTDTVPYESEFSGNAYSNVNNDQSYRVLREQSNPQEMYVSIAPAYRSRIPQPHSRKDADYNAQGVPASEPVQYRGSQAYEEAELSHSSLNVLTANPRSYTIEWMSGSRKASLERARARYSELQNTQIIHYKRNRRDRYALVSMLFVNRSDALDALLTPSLSKVSALFSPKVRQVAWLQSLVGSTPQATNVWTRPRTEPLIHKRQWIGQDDPGEKTYLVGREDLNSRLVDSRLLNVRENGVFATPQRTIPYSNDGPKKSSSIRFEPDYQVNDTFDQVDSYRQVDALLNVPENSYTIQWFSSTNLQSIENLKQRFPELASAVTVHVRHNQKDWYVLIQGQYRNSQEAITALKSPAMNNIALILHPWTRPVKSLRKLQIAGL